MRRVRLCEVGWDRDLQIEQLDSGLGSPEGDKVVVEVGACGVCHRDLIDRSGRFPWIGVPVTPGHEAAGRVVAVGPDVSEWKVGDQVATMHRDHCGTCNDCLRGETSLCVQAFWVFGLMVDGGYATHLLAPERALYRVPSEIPVEHAALLHCTFGTAFRGLHKHGPLSSGMRVLVTGANGGVGSAAVQIANRLGIDVIGVVRDERHASFVERMGASHVIVDEGTGFHKQLGGRRVDLALDTVGQPTFNSAMRSVRMGGGVSAIGNVVQRKVALNLGYIVVNDVRIAGSSGATREDMAEVVRLYLESPLDVAIHGRLGLDRADEAQRSVRRGGLQGRLVLIP